MELKVEQDLTYYQNSIRNIAITSVLSFAILGTANFYKNNKFKFYKIIGVIISLISIIISSILNIWLYKNNNSNLVNLVIINYLFMILHIIIIFLRLHTLYHLINNNIN